MDNPILYFFGMILFIFLIGDREVKIFLLFIIPFALIGYLTFGLELFNPIIGTLLGIFIFSFLGPIIAATHRDGDFTFTKAFKDSGKFFFGWIGYIVALMVIALILWVVLGSSGPYYDF